jgi:type I site-specific restriction-modification system R (restriction) subunit
LHDIFTAGAGAAPRQQQLDCVDRVCVALRTDCSSRRPSNYLVQHATGSGKSLTIAALAHQLTRMTDARGNRFRHVIVVADRKALEEQLGAVVHGFLEAHDDLDLLDRAESCAHLRQLVANDDDSERPCRVIVTTFQKALTRGVDAQPATPAAASANAADAANAADDGDGSDDGESPSVVEATHAVASTDGPCSQRRVAILADEAHRSQ